jgi:RHS repeat-associated protein
VLEETVNGVVQREYTYGLQRISQYQSINGAWTASFYGYDGAGSVRQLTNTAGVVTDEYEYDAFGNSFTKVGTTPNVYLYRGEQYDSDLGLYYLRARYYNPLTDRFLSRDPEDGIDTDPKTLHKYVYAGGDPVNLADPTGRASQAGVMGGGDIGEYAGLIFAISIQAIPQVRAVEQSVVCLLNKSAQTIGGIAANLGDKMFFQSTGQCTEEVKSCKTLYPNLIPVSQLPGFYDFESQGEAASALGEEVGGPVIPRKMSPATGGPCSVGGQYDPGWHINYQSLQGGGYAGSVVGCPVCDDSGDYPVPSQRWGAIVE